MTVPRGLNYSDMELMFAHKTQYSFDINLIFYRTKGTRGGGKSRVPEVVA